MKIAVVGAGGLGSYIGAVLCRVDHDVTLVTRGAHAAAVRSGGLYVRTVDGDFEAHPHCVESALELDGADLTFVTVKSYSLDDVGPQIVHLAQAGSVVVPLLNGVTASERLVGLGVPPSRLVDGIAYVTAFRTDPGHIDRKGSHQRLVVGSSTGAGTDAVALVADAFSDTGVEVTEAEDVLVALWEKMAVVCSLSVICAITGGSMGPIRGHRFGPELQRRAIAEVTAVARSRGVRLAGDTEARIGAILDAFPADFFPSVIHDLRSGRRTEMEELGGTIARLASEAGVEAPLHEAATCAVQLAEDVDRAK